MITDWNRDFDRYLDRLENDESAQGKKVYVRVVAALEFLIGLQAEPVEETPRMKRVRQSRRYPLWRVAHPYVPGVAVRVICWFPPEKNEVVVAVLSGDKASMGDVFYDSVASRADLIIDRWIAETEGE